MTDKKTILLIHPPISKPCEPSPGIAKLAGALKNAGIDCRVYDANLTGLLDILQNPVLANPARSALQVTDCSLTLSTGCYSFWLKRGTLLPVSG